MHVEERTERKKEWRAVLLLTGLIVLAAVLRFWRLGDWNFQATEIFTLRDSNSPQFGNPRPLGYLLNYYVARPLLPLDEFGLRVLPAIFGVLAIPAFYFIGRSLIGVRAALFGTLFLVVSPLLILYSQLARYWSLVFLFTAVYPYAIYIGVRERNRRMLALGFLTGLLAVLAHPVSVLLVGGLAIWFLVTYLRPARLAQLWSQRSVRWGVSLALILAAVLAVRFVPMLQGWISAHDRNPGSGQFLVLRYPPGPRQLFYLVNFAEGLTFPLVLCAAAGIYLLWRGRDRSLAFLLTSLALFPVAFLTLLSLRTSVSTYYLLPTIPVFFMGAGVFLDWVSEHDCNLRPRWLLPATLAAVVIVTGAPTLISDYRDGRRYDFRSAARLIERQFTPGDVVFSDQPMVLAHYLSGVEVQRLRDSTALEQSRTRLHQTPAGETLWVVAPAPSHAFRADLRSGGLNRWMYDHCRIRNTIGVGRADLRQQYLQIYRCSSPSPLGNDQYRAGHAATD
jgi:hypothetical protein